MNPTKDVYGLAPPNVTTDTCLDIVSRYLLARAAFTNFLKPGAARALLAIAKKRPEVLREVFAD